MFDVIKLSFSYCLLKLNSLRNVGKYGQETCVQCCYLPMDTRTPCYWVRRIMKMKEEILDENNGREYMSVRCYTSVVSSIKNKDIKHSCITNSGSNMWALRNTKRKTLEIMANCYVEKLNMKMLNFYFLFQFSIDTADLRARLPRIIIIFV